MKDFRINFNSKYFKSQNKNPVLNKTYKYYAFISYARKDSTKFAKYIQRELEHYRYPMAGIEEFRKPNDKQYLRKIFLDLNELENSEKTFHEELLKKIEDSKYLVVLSSLESAKSKWVDSEIQHFLKTHDNDYSLIIPVLVNGKVPDNIPPSLKKDDILSRNLPSFVQFEGDDKNEARERGLSQLIAYLLGVQRDKVSNRFQIEKRKQHVRIIKIFAALLFLFLTLTCWAFFERTRAITNERLAVEHHKEAVANYDLALKNEKIAKENEAKALENEKIAKENEAKALENEKIAKENEQKAIANEKKAIENEKKAIANEKKAKENEAKAIRNEQIAKKNEQIAIKKREEQRYITYIIQLMLGSSASLSPNATVKDVLESHISWTNWHDNPFIKVQLKLIFANCLVQHNTKKAEELLHEIYKIIQMLPPELKNNKLADYYSTYGDCCSENSNAEIKKKSVEYYLKALTYNFDTPISKVECLMHLADAYYKYSDYKNAEKYALQALSIMQTINNGYIKEKYIVEILGKLIDVYICLQEYKKAHKCSQMYLKIVISYNSDYPEAYVKNSELLYLSKNYKECYDFTKKYISRVENSTKGSDYYYGAVKIRNNTVLLLAHSKLYPDDIQTAKELNRSDTAFLNDSISKIVNAKDDFKDDLTKGGSIRGFYNAEYMKLLWLQDIPCNFTQYRKQNYNAATAEALLAVSRYKEALFAGEKALNSCNNDVLRLNLFSLLIKTAAELNKQTPNPEYQAKADKYRAEFNNLYVKVKEEIKNAKTTPAQKAVLSDEIEKKMVARINQQ